MPKKKPSRKKKFNFWHQNISLSVFTLLFLIVIVVGIWGGLLTLSKTNSIPSNLNEKSKVTQKLSPSPQPTTSSAQKKEAAIASFSQPIGYQLRVPVLYYHYIGNNPNPADKQRDSLSVVPDKFRIQMKYLKDNGFTAISLDTLYAALNKQTTLPLKPVVLTFDDGYIDFYFNAFPILQEYGMHSTVFIPVGLVGKPAYLNWDQIRFMNNSGLISFQSHGVNHVNMNSLSESQLDFEMQESKKVLQSQLGIPANFVSYPYGVSSTAVLSAAKEAGFVGGVGTWPSTIQSEGTIYNMPRIRIGGGTTIDDFASGL